MMFNGLVMCGDSDNASDVTKVGVYCFPLFFATVKQFLFIILVTEVKYLFLAQIRHEIEYSI